jgi:hypothetical protein
MITDLTKKNEFVLALRDHLQSIYSTEHNYTFGEGDFEGKKIGEGYSLVRRDAKKPKDISGFVFRKDLCAWAPQNESDIIKDVHKFFEKYKNLESVIEEDGKRLSIKFGSTDYIVHTHIDGGYAGEISVYLVNIPFLKIA